MALTAPPVPSQPRRLPCIKTWPPDAPLLPRKRHSGGIAPSPFRVQHHAPNEP